MRCPCMAASHHRQRLSGALIRMRCNLTGLCSVIFTLVVSFYVSSALFMTICNNKISFPCEGRKKLLKFHVFDDLLYSIAFEMFQKRDAINIRNVCSPKRENSKNVIRISFVYFLHIIKTIAFCESIKVYFIVAMT